MIDNYKILSDLVGVIEECRIQPLDASEESIEKWETALAEAKNFLKSCEPKHLTLEQVIDRATD